MNVMEMKKNNLFRYSFSKKTFKSNFPFSLKKIKLDNLKKILIKFDSGFITKTFKAIIKSKNSVFYTQKEVIDKFSLLVLDIIDENPVYKLRLNYQERIYGYLSNNCFYVFAYDPIHKIKG